MTPSELADEVVAKANTHWHYLYTPMNERFPIALKVWVEEAIKKALDEIQAKEPKELGKD